MAGAREMRRKGRGGEVLKCVSSKVLSERGGGRRRCVGVCGQFSLCARQHNRNRYRYRDRPPSCLSISIPIALATLMNMAILKIAGVGAYHRGERSHVIFFGGQRPPLQALRTSPVAAVSDRRAGGTDTAPHASSRNASARGVPETKVIPHPNRADGCAARNGSRRRRPEKRASDRPVCQAERAASDSRSTPPATTPQTDRYHARFLRPVP